MANTQGAELTASSARPASVPADFVVTPHGYFHPSCVIELGAGERVHPSGEIARADGSVRSVTSCAFPRFDRAGQVVTDPAKSPPRIDGWVSSEQNTGQGPVAGLWANWTVPAAPPVHAGQQIYLFPGLQSLATGSNIFQPVLGWNQRGDGHQRWTMASWDCCLRGNDFHSQIIPVNAGDSVSGTMTAINCDARGVCADWEITSADNSNGMSSTLHTTSNGQAMDWLFGGVLEVYAVDQCAQLPASNSIQFSGLTTVAASGGTRSFNWSPVFYDNPTPSCSFGASSSDPSDVTLSWCAVGQRCGGVCTDTLTDRNNCGSCGHRCREEGLAYQCRNGECGCPPGTQPCCGGDFCRAGRCPICP